MTIYNKFWEDLKSGRFASMVKESAKGQSISNAGEAYNILKPLYLEENDVEKVFFIFLDGQNKILGLENLFTGSITSSAIYPREIIKRVLSIKATSVIMSHNHPSGTVNPSAEDREITLKVGLALSSIDVALHDHIIIGDGYHSMNESGIISKCKEVYRNITKGAELGEPVAEKINIEIMENELSATDWELNPLAWELYWWVDFFQIAFFRDQPVPIPALTFERARVNNLGSYRIGRNDFAVREQINLNRLYLTRPLFEVLATLFHEMVHSWEFTYLPKEKRTKSWYHGKAFRDKMAEFGILCNPNGSHAGLDYNGKFVQTLRQHAVEFNIVDITISGGSMVIPIDPKPKMKGKSKLKRWTCGCQLVRVGKREFSATCDICGNKFRLDE